MTAAAPKQTPSPFTGDTLIVWAAGYLDAKGRFEVTRKQNGSYKSVHVAARSADREPLERLEAALGGGVYVELNALFRWNLQIPDMPAVLARVRPFMSASRQAAIDAILAALRNERGTVGRPRTHANLHGGAKAEAIWEKEERRQKLAAKNLPPDLIAALPEIFAKPVPQFLAGRHLLPWTQGRVGAAAAIVEALLEAGYLVASPDPENPIWEKRKLSLRLPPPKAERAHKK